MPLPTKILHVSDTHLGKRMYQSDERRKDFAKGFDAAVSIAIEENVDAVIHTGDLFDDAYPNLPTINECADILHRLDEADIPLYVIVGNHERKMGDQWVDLMGRFDLVHRLDKTPTRVGNFSLYGFDAIRKREWETTDMTMEPPEDDTVSIVAMHHLFKPIVPEHKGADYELQEVLNRFNFTPDGIALGDFHSKEVVEIDGCKAFYAGATERTSRAETSQPTCLLLTADDKGDLTIETKLIKEAPGDAPRPFATGGVKFNEHEDARQQLKEEIETLKHNTDNFTEAVVVFTLTGVSNEISPTDVHQLLEREGVTIRNVLDKRNGLVNATDIDADDLADDIQSIPELLEEELASLDIDSTVHTIADLADDKEVAKTNIRDRTKDILDEGIEGDTQ